jgi:hypothetical protein
MRAPMGFLIVSWSLAGVMPCSAVTVWDLWTAPSRLSTRDASRVLLAEAAGEAVAAADLFEAEKHLRTDGGISASELILDDMLARLLARRARQAGAGLRVRVLPPVLHWLQGTRRSAELEVRGETVQLAVLSLPDDAALTVLLHRTLCRDWRLCDGAPCFTLVKSPLRRAVSYVLTTGEPAAPTDVRASTLLLASELTGWLREAVASPAIDGLGRACDPFPSEAVARLPQRPQGWFRHAAERTLGDDVNQVLCSFRSDSPARGKLSYLVSGTVAVPPASAARSAITHNPLDFELFDEVAAH